MNLTYNIGVSEAQRLYQAALEAVRRNPEDEDLAEDLAKAWYERDSAFYKMKLHERRDVYAQLGSDAA